MTNRRSVARSNASARLLQATDVAIERDPAHGYVLDRVVHSGTGVRGRRRIDRRSAPGIHDLRQAGPAGRAVLRGDDLRDSLARIAETQQSIIDAVARAIRALGASSRTRACRVSRQRSGRLRPRSGRSSHRRALFDGPFDSWRPDGALATLEEVLLRHALASPSRALPSDQECHGGHDDPDSAARGLSWRASVSTMPVRLRASTTC